jgi:protease I
MTSSPSSPSSLSSPPASRCSADRRRSIVGALPILLGFAGAALLVSVAGGCSDRDEAATHAGSATGPLAGRRVAILADQGFEQAELLKPRAALDAAGAATVVISPRSGSIRAWNVTDWGRRVPVDVVLSAAQPGDYDALLLPGGVMNPDHLRMDPQAVAFVRAFVTAGKPIAAICHGPWTLIEADGVRGKHLTSWPSLKTDLTNAGAIWTDAAMVRDGQLVTSRKPADIPEFDRALIEMISQSPKR